MRLWIAQGAGRIGWTKMIKDKVERMGLREWLARAGIKYYYLKRYNELQ